MGTSYDFDRDVVNVDGVRFLPRLIGNPNDQESGEPNRQIETGRHISSAGVGLVAHGKSPWRGGDTASRSGASGRWLAIECSWEPVSSHNLGTQIW